MAEEIIILGVGGSASDALDVIAAINARSPEWIVRGFLDDGCSVGDERHGSPVLGPLRMASEWPESFFINTIGSDRSFPRRPELIATCGVPDNRFATLVHPLACVSSSARVGVGVHINYGVSIGGGASIGDHVTLCPGCIIGHDTVVEPFSIVAPGAVISGFCRIGRCSYVGAGATIRQVTTVGAGAIVGMGAVVLEDVPASATVVGNPAKLLDRSRRTPEASADAARA